MPAKPIWAIALLLLVILWNGLPGFGSAQALTATPEAGNGPDVVTEPTASATPLPEGISFPEKDALLDGVLDISGTALSAWSVSFAYRDNPTNTWFLLAQSSEPVSGGVLATWDTNSISDGSYVLRLRIQAANGPEDMTVGVSVGNHLPAGTATPAQTMTIAPGLTETNTPAQLSIPGTETIPAPLISPTRLPALPTNPAVLNPQDIYINLGKGVLGVVVVFGCAGFVLFLRRR